MYEIYTSFFLAIVMITITCFSFSYCSSERELTHQERLKALEEVHGAIEKWNGNTSLISTREFESVLKKLK